jgi:DNA repair exonuclease SbcCD ATPase subunit
VKLLRLELWEWRRFRGGPHTFEFTEDATVIFGPNESGKSTIFEAVRRVLFDRNRTTSQWVQRLVPYGSPGATPRAMLDFEHGGRRLRIEKSFSQRGTARLCEALEDGTLSEIARNEEAAEALTAALKARAGSGRGASRPEDWGALQWLFMPQAAEERSLPDPGSDAAGALGLRQAGVSRDYDLVLAAARKECDRWYTPGGKVRTGSELHAAEVEIETLESSRKLLLEHIEELEAKRSRYDELEEQLPRQREDFDTASRAWDSVQNEALDLTDARGTLWAAEERVGASRQAAEEAERIVRERERREHEAGEAREALRRAESAGAQSRVLMDRVTGEWRAARDEAARLGARTNEVRTGLLAAKDALELKEKRLQLEDLRARGQRAAELDAAIVEAKRTATARGEPPDAQLVTQAREVEARARAKHYALGETRLRVHRKGDVEVLADGSPLRGAEGTAIEEVVVRVQGGGEVRVEREAREARRLEAEALELERELAAILAPHAVATTDELQALRDAGLRAAEHVTSLERQREAVDPRPTAGMRGRIAELEGELSALGERRSRAPEPRLFEIDVAALKAEIAALQADMAQTDRAFQDSRKARERLEAAYQETNERHTQVQAELEAAQERDRRAAHDLDHHRDQFGSTESCRRNLDDRHRELEAALEEERRGQGRLESLEQEAESRRTTARLALQRAQESLNAAEAEMRLLEAELEREAAKGAWTRLAEVERRLEAERSRRDRLELSAKAALRLRETLEAVRAEVVERVVAPIKGALDLRLAHVTAGRYALATLDQHLRPTRLAGTREACEFEDGSEGLRELVNLLVRLSVAVDLARSEPQALILDDPCVHVSRERTARLVELLNRLMAEHPLQVVVLTHRGTEFGGLVGSIIDLSARQPPATAPASPAPRAGARPAGV